MTPYKFTTYDGVPEIPPETDITKLIHKADGDVPLTREEKDKLADVCYGLFANGNPTYRLMGWAFSVYGLKQIRRVLVSTSGQLDKFQAYYVPDKTSLRKTLKSIGRIANEMIYADEVAADPEPEDTSSHD